MATASASSAGETVAVGLGRRLPGLRALLPRIAPAVIAATVVTVVAEDGGGYAPRTWRLVAFALLALSAAALVARDRIVLGRLEWWLLGLMTAVAGWTALSSLWSDQPSTSLLEGERVVVYLAAAAVVLVVAERSSLAQLFIGIVAGVTVASAWGLGFYLFGKRTLDPYEGNLLFRPLGYANALGIYASMAILLTLGLALVARRPWQRALALAPLFVLVPTLYYTSSRGAWIALVAGLVVLFGLAGRLHLRPAKLVSLLALGLIAAQLLGSGGLALAGDNRPHYWAVAWRDYEAHPWLGAGAGTFGSYWVQHRTVDSFVQDVHNLYLESLAELGPLGLLLVGAALIVPLLGLRRREDVLVAAAAASYLAFVLHVAVDWDWEVPAVTLTGLFCGAAVLVGTRRPQAPPLTVRGRAVLLGGAVVLATLAAVRFAMDGGSLAPFW
jgi:O-antigen ligase